MLGVGGAVGAEQETQIVDLLVSAKSLLERQDAAGACEVLERAKAMQADHVVVRTLLALSYFKMERFEEAEELYKALINELPLEVALYVNLSMLYLQQHRVRSARSILDMALQYHPNDKKIHSSLGLVYARLEEYTRARDHFLLAGQEDMAERMARKIEESAPKDLLIGAGAPNEGGELMVGLDGTLLPMQHAMTQPEQRAITAEQEAEISGGAKPLLLLHEDSASTRPTEPVKTYRVSSVLEVENESWPVVVVPSDDPGLPPPSAAEIAAAEEDVPFSLSQQDLPDFALAAQSTPPPAAADLADYDYSAVDEALGLADIWWEVDEDAEAPRFWSREADILEIRCDSQIYTRIQGMMSMTGSLTTAWEFKRFQGKPIEQIFGPPENPLARIAGSGVVRLHIDRKHHLNMMQMTEPLSAYFREGAVLAFGSQISWENGRVPSPAANIPDLPLDNLWGEGAILVLTENALRGFHIKAGQRVRVAYSQLVGWIGALVPRILYEKHLALPERAAPAFVEFEGEGAILVTKYNTPSSSAA